MDPRATGGFPTNLVSLKAMQQAAEEADIRQDESAADFMSWIELEAFNPMAMMRRFEKLEKRMNEKLRAEEKRAEEEEGKVMKIEEIEESAARFQNQNRELQAKTLLILRSRITPSDTSEEIIQKLLEAYPDPALADEALDFLLETADPKTMQALRQAKEQFNTRFESEIKSGRNIGAQSREFAEKGLGSATSLREMYKDITQTPRDPLKLFDELAGRFNYEKLKNVIRFLLHSLGADLRAKGSSIPRPELKRLIDETRSLQGILGVFRFFQSRMSLINNQFSSYGVIKPIRLDFEALAKQFVKFLAERFMTPDKIILSARLLGISHEAIAQLIIFTQMRDAIKQIAPRYYRTPQQRDELFLAFLKALEMIEDQLEEEEEKEEEEKKKKKPKKEP